MNSPVLLPYPVSTNRYWKNYHGRVVVSAEAKAYKDEVRWAWRAARAPMLTGEDVKVLIILHPRMTLAGEASKTRIDLGNAEKVCSDALNGIAWIDDKQIVDLHLKVGDPVKNGGLSVSVKVA